MPLLFLGLGLVVVLALASRSSASTGGGGTNPTPPTPTPTGDDTMLDQNGVTWDLLRSLEPIPGGGSAQYSGVPRGTLYPPEARFMYLDNVNAVRAEIMAYAAKWAATHVKLPPAPPAPPPVSTASQYVDKNGIAWALVAPVSIAGPATPWIATALSGRYAGQRLDDNSLPVLKAEIETFAALMAKWGAAGAPSTLSIAPDKLPPIPPALAAGCKNYDSGYPLEGTLLAKTGPDLYRLKPFASFATDEGIVIARKYGYLTGSYLTGGIAYGKVVEVIAVTMYGTTPVDLSDHCILFDLPKEG